MNVHERCEMAVAILQETSDGDDLLPDDLWIVQEAVNGHLDDEGLNYFAKLHARVVSGDYAKETKWFHGIEHLTITNIGYVRWKGVEVEHYNRPWAFSPEGKESALELARRCRILEEQGVEPSSITAIWKWEEPTAQEA